MSHAPENEDDVSESERFLKSAYVINAGLMGRCVLFLATMIAIPKNNFDSDLNQATIAFAVALPLLAGASLTHLVKLFPDWTILFFSQPGWLVFVFGMEGIFYYINWIAGTVFGAIYLLLYLSWLAGSIMVSIKRMRIRRKMRKQMQKQAEAAKIRLQAMQSAAARNGAQRPPHSSIVRREMKYHRPIERSRAGNLSNTYVFRTYAPSGSH